MASAAQIQANRLNAQKSTGPRTAAGKERASRNALKHGLLAREAVIQGEAPEEFELFREGMLEELAPAGAVEAMLAERVVSLSWRLRRAERLQNAAFAALDEGEPTPLLEARHEEWKQLKGSEWERGVAGLFDEDAALGKVVVEDFGGARVLDRLLVYERRIESSLYRTMAQLRQERRARATPTPEGVSRSESDLAAGQGSATPAELASFGADVVPEGGAEGVSSAESQVAGNGSDFPLPTCEDNVLRRHYELAGGRGGPSFHHSRPVPDVPAEEQSCGTNPISGGVSRGARPGASESCGRNPISEGGPAGLGQEGQVRFVA